MMVHMQVCVRVEFPFFFDCVKSAVQIQLTSQAFNKLIKWGNAHVAH